MAEVLCYFQWKEYPTHGLRLQVMQAETREDQSEKKHLIYRIIARKISATADPQPVIFDRRYTHFADLFFSLKKDYPNLMTPIEDFPGKKVFGNFTFELAEKRGLAFDKLLNHILKETSLRTSKAMLGFLHDHERKLAKVLLSECEYQLTVPILENIFLLLNKIYTDLHPPVILALCRLFDCCSKTSDLAVAFKYGNLAINRFERVCDIYLLELYIPLIHACINVWNKCEKDDTFLNDQLLSLKRQGINVKPNMNLLAAIDTVEKKL